MKMFQKMRHVFQEANEEKTGCMVFLYHRISDLANDPQLLCVHPKNFEEQIKYLKTFYDIVSLKHLCEFVANGKNMERTVAITFDDGYADNFLMGKEIIETYGLPVTIFISSANINSDREFWWDELENIVLRTPALPKKIHLQIEADRNFTWDLGSASAWSMDEVNSYERWDVCTGTFPTSRHHLYVELNRILRHLKPLEREEALLQLHEQTGITLKGRSTHRSLNHDEIRRLAASPQIEIGGHSLNHATLSQLSEIEQHHEIRENQSELERILGKPVDSFSYPFGNRGDYNRATKKILKKAGFRLACANVPKRFDRSDDVREIPRFIVRNWNADEFAEWLHNL